MIGNINNPINSLTAPCFQKIRLENVFSTFHHQEIPLIEIIFVAWMRDLSWEVKIVYLFFQEDTSRKFLILLLSYFPVFWLQISSAFAIIFADCHGLSCVHVRASSYRTLFRVSLGGVGLRCVGLAEKISARCNTGSYVFSFFFIHSLPFIITHLCFFIPSDLEAGYEKSILTRAEILFYHYLFQRTPVICNFISQENVFLFAISFH